ncbi:MULTISPECIES: spore germination protein [unclassified Paenibacillus]|uniref:spore germination protein n=1 Tax=unclassified Paenibacillus TaxID=185978 RepID=UPI002785237F|nr:MULTISPECIES: spore germination protein [unclassified Paenibacillus]MDQ0902546.1 spore germination protein PA [Paenibacillus sp. V4I7]MDQ0918944.1 spore germination protein PA [Paenibacillus sp. V4I5]
MPSIVGNVKIISVGSSSVVHFGDSFIIAPNSTAKTFAGAGSFNTGDFPRIYNAYSTTVTNDSDLIENNANKVII